MLQTLSPLSSLAELDSLGDYEEPEIKALFEDLAATLPHVIVCMFYK
jgi:hypothetical protein